jgi:hypothetical protein
MDTGMHRGCISIFYITSLIKLIKFNNLNEPTTN